MFVTLYLNFNTVREQISFTILPVFFLHVHVNISPLHTYIRSRVHGSTQRNKGVSSTSTRAEHARYARESIQESGVLHVIYARILH